MEEWHSEKVLVLMVIGVEEDWLLSDAFLSGEKCKIGSVHVVGTWLRRKEAVTERESNIGIMTMSNN